MKTIDKVLTVSEASERWGKDVRTLRSVFNTGAHFKRDLDTRKSGSTWLVTHEAMERVYGEENGNNQGGITMDLPVSLTLTNDNYKEIDWILNNILKEYSKDHKCSIQIFTKHYASSHTLTQMKIGCFNKYLRITFDEENHFNIDTERFNDFKFSISFSYGGYTKNAEQTFSISLHCSEK